MEDKENRNPNEHNVSNTENSGSDTDTCISITRPASRSQPQAQKLPKCPHPDCTKQTDEKKKRHRIADCGNCHNDEDRQALYDMVKARRSGPAANTRSTTQQNRNGTPTTGRLTTPNMAESAAIDTDLKGGDTTFRTTGRCDDGSDDSIVCPSVAEAAALRGIGRIKAIRTVRIKVALEKEGTSPECTFSRCWSVPECILQLRAAVWQFDTCRFSLLMID